MNAKDGVIADTLERCLISSNVADSNGEPANLVDVVNQVSRGLNHIALSITRTNLSPWHSSEGVEIACVTEGLIYVGLSLSRIADAINNLADATRGV